jgi:cobalt-zinc-cadmium efflux system membrane fusion protein
MMNPASVSTSIRQLSTTLLMLGWLAGTPMIVLAHSGHGDEFKGGSAQSSGSVQVDAETAQRLVLRLNLSRASDWRLG